MHLFANLRPAFVCPVFVLSCSVMFHSVFVFVYMLPYMVIMLDSNRDRGCCTFGGDPPQCSLCATFRHPPTFSIVFCSSLPAISLQYLLCLPPYFIIRLLKTSLPSHLMNLWLNWICSTALDAIRSLPQCFVP